jgi:hypothetical protein
MHGVSANGKEAIALVVAEMFNRIALGFVGDIPRMASTKNTLYSYVPSVGLATLFIASMGSRQPNLVERDTLKSLLTSSDDYVDSLKSSTVANVTNRVDALAREARLQQRSIQPYELEKIMSEELGKARWKLQTIAEAETTKIRNMGSMVKIAETAGAHGESDPTVFFIVTRDGSTCKECIRLHLMPDKVTPKLWKLSEVKQGWHKRGDESPSVCGLHPFCRCSLTILPPGYAFSASGLIEYRGQSHDEISNQREK